MKNKLSTSLLSALFCACSSGLQAEEPKTGNPVIQHIYTCDPSALVVNDTLYIVSGHEQSETPYNWPFVIKDWHIFSTTDMVHYTDHGPILDAKAFEWMPEGYCWASHITPCKGKYYWYVCSWGEIGVAVSDHLFGPYTDPLGKPMMGKKDPKHNDISNIDPAVFIDDDGQAYIYWGGEGNLKMCRLKENMIELDGDPIRVKGLKDYEEAPWVFKRDGIYYLAYSASNGYRKGPIRYAMGSSPLGPWEDMGDILGVAYNSFTNHEAIVEYKGQWYMVYHNGALPGGGDYNRSVCVDKLFFNKDHTIQFVEQTTGGVKGLNAYNNFGPHAYAGVDATCVLPQTLTLNSRVVDDGRIKAPLSWKWEVASGPGKIEVVSNQLQDHVLRFSQAGNYTLRLTANDGYRECSDEVHVKVFPEVNPRHIVYQGKSGDTLSIRKKGEYLITLRYTSHRSGNLPIRINGTPHSLPFIRTTYGYTPCQATTQVQTALPKGISRISIPKTPGIEIEEIIVSTPPDRP